MVWLWWTLGILGGFLLCVFIYDVLLQRRRPILHNFPLVGHIRYWLIIIGLGTLLYSGMMAVGIVAKP